MAPGLGPVTGWNQFEFEDPAQNKPFLLPLSSKVGFIWQLPSRIKYSNVKLTRPVGKESHLITDWLISFSQQVSRKTACISAMTADGTVVASWSLDGVMPVRWSGPSLNLDSPKVAMETLELAHHGFLPASGVGR